MAWAFFWQVSYNHPKIKPINFQRAKQGQRQLCLFVYFHRYSSALRSSLHHRVVGVLPDWKGHFSDLPCPSRRSIRSSLRHGRGIEPEEFTKGLGGDDGAGDGIPLRHRLLKKELQGFPGVATQIGKKIPVPRSGRGQAQRKYRRRIFGMLKTTCRWGTFLSTWEQSHPRIPPPASDVVDQWKGPRKPPL